MKSLGWSTLYCHDRQFGWCLLLSACSGMVIGWTLKLALG